MASTYMLRGVVESAYEKTGTAAKSGKPYSIPTIDVSIGIGWLRTSVSVTDALKASIHEGDLVHLVIDVGQNGFGQAVAHYEDPYADLGTKAPAVKVA